MKYRIAYDQPGRLRVRFGPDAFTQEQGYGIAALLLGCPGITGAETCPVNGSVLVLYRGDGRAAALAVLDGLRRDALPVGAARDADQLREVDDHFFRRIAGLTARHFLKRWFLPAPIRCLVTLWSAAGYWREGLNSLREGRLDVAVLDAASIAGAIVQREWATAGSVMFLLRLSGLLEDYTRKRTQTSLRQSLAIHVDTVWRGKRRRRRGVGAHGDAVRGGAHPGARRLPDPGGRHGDGRRRHGQRGVHDRRVPPRPQAGGLHRLRRHRAGGGQPDHPDHRPGRGEPHPADRGPHRKLRGPEGRGPEQGRATGRRHRALQLRRGPAGGPVYPQPHPGPVGADGGLLLCHQAVHPHRHHLRHAGGLRPPDHGQGRQASGGLCRGGHHRL